MADANSDVTLDANIGDVWFVYDGECLMCANAARALQIRKSVGELHLVDARAGPSPVLDEVNAAGLDLDKGAVIKFGAGLYHGQDAMHMMALLGSGQGWFNRLNATLFRSRTISRAAYPFLRGCRNLLIRLRGSPKLQNLHQIPSEPMFQHVFGADWDRLPPVMKDHYGIRPFSDDEVTIEGTLDISLSWFMKIFARLSGVLVPYEGKDVPVRVTFRSSPNGAFCFDRLFQFPERPPHRFLSRLEYQEGNEVIEFMSMGVGWRAAYEWDGTKVIVSHRGYVWRILGVKIPIPAALFIGRGYAEELPQSEDSFAMWTHSLHPVFGKTFGYKGAFRVVSKKLD